jgi:hypothetical protein
MKHVTLGMEHMDRELKEITINNTKQDIHKINNHWDNQLRKFWLNFGHNFTTIILFIIPLQALLFLIDQKSHNNFKNLLD